MQGVFFRASAKQKADELSIAGFVKNEKNGDVYIEAEGEENLLKKFVEWCKKGPSRANVKEVKTEESGLKNFRNFEIHR